ncbi:MAG: MarR family transcriptional regulator [Rhizobiaceae bacterium]
MQDRPESSAILQLEAFTPYRLLRAAEEVSRRFARHYKDRHGMTRPEWRTLATIGQFDTITAKQIGSHSSMHKTKISRAVRALEQRRWLERSTDEHDRRIEHLRLTRAGRRAYEELVEIARGFERDLVGRVGSEGFGNLRLGLDAVEAMIHDGSRPR